MTETELIVRIKVKELVHGIDKQKKVNASEDFYSALNDKVKHLIEEAAKRARANGRNTVMAKDV